ncbi:ABC transporter substrate-binding protein [Nitratireductor soli]|uniref:ABC transporter substrate-binding protein n=1 Tax=Nitratireductor soli TaxID=1670619 RepID=UPI0009E45E56|nr:ABC transporter substrate-binding protein [Nitratireductor soli]
MKRLWQGLVPLVLACGLVTADMHDVSAQVHGGDLVVGLGTRLNRPDHHVTTAQADSNVATHIYEALTVFDGNTVPQPQLAESFEVSPDGLTYTFKLRKGVKFHNGDVMDSGDVLASFERHKRISPGKSVQNNIAQLSAPDPDTFVITLKEAQPLFLEMITALQYRVVVIPAEDRETEAAANSGVGTGPYKFVEHVADAHVKLARFEDYVPDEHYDGPIGTGGKRTPYFDTITFRVAVEGSARVAGVQTGEMHVADNIPAQASERLSADPNIQVVDVMPFAKVFTVLHTGNAPTNNLLVRRAIQSAINAEDTLDVAMEGFYQLDHSFLFPSSPYHPKEVGKDLYNQGNLEKAKALLNEAGYKGEEVKIMTNANYPFMENSALVLQQQLMALGMAVEIEMVDWPTNVARRTDGEGGWNITISSSTAQGPLTYFTVFKNYAQVKEDAILDEAYSRVVGSPDLEDRKKAWIDVEARVADQVYLVPSGNRGMKIIASSKVKNLTGWETLRLWDVWFEN